MRDMFLYRKVRSEGGAYVITDKPSPCTLKDVYERLILFFWFSQGVEHHNSGPIDLDREKDPVEAVEIEVMKRS